MDCLPGRLYAVAQLSDWHAGPNDLAHAYMWFLIASKQITQAITTSSNR